jgi:hypothetical protein
LGVYYKRGGGFFIF